MNKKIKVIELLNMVANKEKLPKKIKYGEPSFINKIYELSDVAYIDYIAHYEGKTNCLFLDHNTNILNDYVEILEDEEEIDIQELEDVNLFDNGQNFNDMPIIIKSYDDNFTNINNTINKLVQAVKQLDKKINKE